MAWYVAGTDPGEWILASPEPLLPRALAAPPAGGSPLTFLLALLGAGLVHLFALLALSFEMPRPGPEWTPEEALEVVILADGGAATESPAPDAALSQRSRAGDSPQGTDAATLLDAQDLPDTMPAGTDALGEDLPDAQDPEVPPEPPPPGIQVERIEPEPQPEPPAEAEPEALAAEAPEPDPLDRPKDPPANAAQILGSRNQEIARLTASLEARTAAYASRQRRKSISASTREFRYASYLGAWARKVERIGNLNYPREAKEQGLHGNLILHVALKKDGSVEKIRVVRSSGQDLLDQAAIRIVELAAPYSPFPPDIAAETDVLDIVRTWQFQRGGRLGWEN